MKLKKLNKKLKKKFLKKKSKPKHRMVVFTITEPVYMTSTLVISNCTNKQMVDYMTRRFGIEREYDDRADGLYFKIENKKMRQAFRVIWTREFNKQPYWMGVMLHELVHLTVRILDDKGIPIVRDIGLFPGDESAAYLYENLAIQYLKRLGM